LPVLLPLGVVWAAGFVLLTASVAQMSASLAGVVRSMEPITGVMLGLLAGERYSLQVLAALVPVCAGVVLASHGGGSMTLSGVCLAMLSNFGFSARPFLARRLKARPGRQLDDTAVFFNVTCIATALLVFAALLVEGPSLLPTAQRLRAGGEEARFGADLLLSGSSFFVYQYSQLVVMSRVDALTFSVLTPISKASMIVACALYFGDALNRPNILGIVVVATATLLFAAAKRRAERKEQ